MPIMASRRSGFAVGKVPPEILSRTVYSRLGRKDRRVIVGPGIGRDSAAVKYNKKILVFTSDPVTGTPSNIGQHSVEINANDVAVTGARPKWYLCTILLPIGTTKTALDTIAAEIHDTATKLGISVIGGHTEATPGLNRPLISGFMIGESTGRVLTAGQGKQGDRVLLTKTAGLEGTAILAKDKASLLRTKGVSQAVMRVAQSYQSQISVVAEALLATRIHGVHALHDPTEGGILNGLWEIAVASKLGITVYADVVPVATATQRVCMALGLDPLKLMSSGSLLLAVKRSRCQAVQKALARSRIVTTQIGVLTSLSQGRFVVRNGQRRPLVAVPKDELYRI